MPNISIGNYATTVPNDSFEHIWKLTRAMKYAGWTTLGSSNGTSTATGSNSGDLWGSQSNPLLDSYPSNTTLTTGSWIIMQGPSTLVLSISSSFTGSFIRGENITQTSTNATGELIGANIGTNGYLVIGPRVNGNSTGSMGWNISPITGAITNESLNILNLKEYLREVVFWRGSDPNKGAIYYQCVLSGGVSGSADTRFSQLTGSIGCTTSSAPGGGGSGNGFPTNGSLVVLGTGGANAPANWSFANYGDNIGFSQIMCLDATGTTLRTQDGTFNIFMGLTTTGTRVYSGFGFNVLDNTENGDIDPYIWYAPTSQVNNARTRLATTSLVTPIASCGTFPIIGGALAPYDIFIGFRRRGLGGISDTYANFTNGFIGVPYFSYYYPVLSISTEIESEATGTSPRRVKEPIWVISYYPTLKFRKGTLRWMYYVCGGSPGGRGNDTMDGKYWFQIMDGATTHTNAIIVGPYDQISTPING